MAIVDMSRFSLITFARGKEALLERLQKFGTVHVSEVSEEDRNRLRAVDTQEVKLQVQSQMARWEEAITQLSPYVEEPSTLQEKFGNALPEVEATKSKEEYTKEADEVAQQVSAAVETIRKAEETKRSLEEEIAGLAHWKKLDLSMERMRALRTVRATLGTIPQKWGDEVRRTIAKEMSGTYVEFVGGDAKNYDLLLLTTGKDENLSEFLRDVNFQPVEFPWNGTVAEHIEIQKEQIRKQEKEIVDQKVILKRLAKEHQRVLAIAYEQASERLSRLVAEEKLWKSAYLVFMEGYVPTEKESDFQRAVEEVAEHSYMLDMKPAQREDPEVPIALRNRVFFKPFESLVRTFALPHYNEMDPTALFAPWYIVFFGIMLGDLGYGTLLFLGSTLALHLFRWKPQTEQSLRFFQILSVFAMIAGACFGSIFGGLIPMKALIIDPTKDYMTMIVFSLGVGFIHLLVGLVLKGVQEVRNGDASGALYDAGSWILILCGLLLVGLTSILSWPAVVKTVGAIMAIVGAFLVLFFSARAEKGAGRYAWGAYNLYGATGYIGDLVSYTRLTAIMLAGAYIGFAMNIIGDLLLNLGIPGVVLAAVVLVAAHLFNLFLSSLSAYVHSMRLIYVEFFGKFYEGGGKPFHGLKPEPKYVKLEKE